jgi:hypothetical protein
MFEFQYWKVASSCPVGMGLLMGCGTWALWHCPSQQISDFLLKMKHFGGFRGNVLRRSTSTACVTHDENMKAIQRLCQRITYK